MKKRTRRKWILVLCCLFFIWLLSSCKREVPSASEITKVQGYTKPQIMIVVSTERSRYQKVYTKDVWKAVLENGQTFEEYLLGQIKVFMKNLKTMSLLAEIQEITPTTAQKDKLRQVAEEYYQGLSDEELRYLGITLEDVQYMYQEYFLANKVVGELTREIDMEVSDSEAKVISVEQIQVSDRESAETVYEKAAAEGSDFARIAQETEGAQWSERQIGRGEEEASFEELVFALAAGEISPVIEREGAYYVIRCVDDYDAEATEKRKAQIYAERKRQVFQHIYTRFLEEHEFAISEEPWAEIHFSEEDSVSADNFFSLYREEFGEEGY